MTFLDNYSTAALFIVLCASFMVLAGATYLWIEGRKPRPPAERPKLDVNKLIRDASRSQAYRDAIQRDRELVAETQKLHVAMKAASKTRE